jgi:ketosteroid isomerase-like protein
LTSCADGATPGTAPDLDAFADTFDADAELITDPSWVEAGPFKGRAIIKGWFEGLKESYERETIILRELFDAGDKVVAASTGRPAVEPPASRRCSTQQVSM